MLAFLPSSLEGQSQMATDAQTLKIIIEKETGKSCRGAPTGLALVSGLRFHKTA